MSPWFGSCHFHHCTFNSVTICLTFHVSKPSQSTFLNHQTDWFQSWQFSRFCIFLPFIWGKPTHPSDHAQIELKVLSSFTSCSIFIVQVSLPYIKQLTRRIYNVPFSFNEYPLLVITRKYSWNFSTYFWQLLLQHYNIMCLFSQLRNVNLNTQDCKSPFSHRMNEGYASVSYSVT